MVYLLMEKNMEVTETKYLGVIVDCKLNWSPHITYISKKVSNGAGIILKPRNLFTRKHCWHFIIHLFIHTLITVYMYVVKLTMFMSMISSSYKIRLFAVSPRTNVDELHFDHNILSLKRLYSYNIGIFMYQFSKSMLPGLFENVSAMLLLYMNIVLDRHA